MDAVTQGVGHCPCTAAHDALLFRDAPNLVPAFLGVRNYRAQTMQDSFRLANDVGWNSKFYSWIKAVATSEGSSAVYFEEGCPRFRRWALTVDVMDFERQRRLRK